MELAVILPSVIQNSAAENRGSEVKIVLKVSENEKSKRYLCDGNHLVKLWSFREKECFHCRNKGHTSRICRKKAKSKSGRVIQTNQVQGESSKSEDEGEYYEIHHLLKSRNPPSIIDVKADRVVTLEWK